MAKLNIYFGRGIQGERLKQSFTQLSRALGFESESAFCQSLATDHQSIMSLLTEEYNGVDLASITEFIQTVKNYNTEQIYALIGNRAALEALLQADRESSQNEAD